MTKSHSQAPTVNEQPTKRENLRTIMQTAWWFVKHNGYSISEALKKAWLNFKLKTLMKVRIVKFYFQKIDGTIREAYGTMCSNLMPAYEPKNDNRAKNDTVQVYFDTEKQEFRCFKIANLVNVVINTQI